jgi:ATP-dependent DNA helicase RecG
LDLLSRQVLLKTQYTEKNDSITINNRITTELLSDKEINQMIAILVYLHDNSTITNKKGRELTGKYTATVRRYLDRLCEVGFLNPFGGTKNAYYMRIEKNNSLIHNERIIS